MSLPHNGSTAPAITSPDLAWPSRPIARPSPISTPESASYLHSPSPSSSRQASSSSTAPTAISVSRSSSIKGKEKAIETFQLRIHPQNTDDEEPEARERRYGPPKKPLPPHQLGRIAQSFGIIIPNLPQQHQPTQEIRIPTSPLSTSAISPSLPSASSRGRLSPLPFQSPIRSTPFLLSVIPPLSLLPPSSNDTVEEIHRRNKNWRRGRLLPLQPTLGSMLLCIAREYGLPSTIGIGVYLVLLNQPTSRNGSSSGESNYDDDESSGPKISSSTWTALFSPHLIQLAQGGGTGMNSRSSTPSQTPLKSTVYNVSQDEEAEFPPSPISMSKNRITGSKIRRSKSTEPPELVHSHSSNLSTSTSSFSTNLPPTPASMGDTSFNTTLSTSTSSPAVNPIVGTIEFDIDLDEAKWFEGYHSKKSGKYGRHKRSLTSESGMKELNLVNKVSDARPRFLKELDPNVDNDRSPDEEESEQDKLGRYPQDNAEKPVEVVVKEDLLKPGDGRDQNDLLASPIDLSDQSTRLKVQEILDKRGSGIVMAEQLDDLEKMMRQLSPREIRITSPRMLTPRMAAKVANLALPAVPKRSTSKTAPTSSPLAGNFTSSNPHGESDSEDRSQPNSARSNGTFGSAIHLQTSSSQLQVEQVDDTEETSLDRPVWPAVKHGSPGSPTIHEYFSRPIFPQRIQQVRNVSSPAVIPISDETMKRMKDEEEQEPRIGSKEWKPRRPARPPSPKLESVHQRTLSHTLSPELTDYLNKSPPPIASDSTGSGGQTPEEKRRNRSGSISFKGLRSQMSSKNLSQMWKSDAVSPPLPNGQKETVGLFRGGVMDGESQSGFGFGRDHAGLGGGMRSVSSPTTTTDFGPISQAHPSDQDGSLPSAGSGSGSGSGSGKSKFASRIWGFRHHSDKHGHGHDRSSSSKRHPSIDGSIKISEPIAASFIHKESFESSHPLPSHQQQQQSTLGHGRFPSTSSYVGAGAGAGIPTSPNPASPRSIKRKPVPGGEEGMKSSLSLGSMHTFVLEDAPKGRRMG
ncbi:hypothetical protein I302_108742 [Kwoniella bestiolae CBS 10118]|uniref:Uncharacterized protein n=1 Tax=Kwoniella bestiolae CBS 10118 TaxID=1296100 RepID=A0A1B9FTY7_9TREE|nr:hypothetical protein I302_07879 [Kwoniella bestiolae CBS 10118]OCF22234.1 hypothetical protein I302_07879 [Kwoniella bestiolae CBS 10118]